MQTRYDAPTHTTPPSPPAFAPLPRQVLVVEDEPLIREGLQMWLEAAGCETREAEDAETALRVHAEFPAPVVICDIGLGGAHDGIWLSQHLLARRPDTAIIFATGETELSGADTLRHGVTGYLIKPYRRSQMLAQLDLAIAHVREQRVRRFEEQETARLLRDLRKPRSSSPIGSWADLGGMVDAHLLSPSRETRAATTRLRALARAFDIDLDDSGLAMAAQFRFMGRAVAGASAEPSPAIDPAALLDEFGWRNAAEILRGSREDWDGMGPRGLCGEQIPLAARILAVHDGFETLIAPRPAGASLSASQALDTLIRLSGATYDAVVVRTFIGLLTQSPSS